MKKMKKNGSQDPTGRSNPPKPKEAVTICVSPRVLFNMETQPFSPGPASTFVKVLEAVNKSLRELYPDSKELFKVVVIINDQKNRERIMESIKTINDHKLFIEPRSMKDGESLMDVLSGYHADLYLSADPEEVKKALGGGIAAATVFSPEEMKEVSDTQLDVAFDGDAVIFSDESEQVFTDQGLKAFLENERANEKTPMKHGPFKGFLEALGKLQKKFYDKGEPKCPIRTYLVTSRGAASAGTRALITLRSWDLEMDEAHFMSGAPKGPMLEKIRPHIFFDDQMCHVDGAKDVGTVACHVPYGAWPKPKEAVTICVSPRVLFNMETQPFSPGPASTFVKVLEAVNKRLRELYPDSKELFKVVVIINDQKNRERIMESIKTINDHKLFIEPRSMKDGESLMDVLSGYHADLYLSADPEEVKKALGGGIAAATVFSPEEMKEVSDTQLDVAFDGDAVIFSDESEQVFTDQGLKAFLENERANEKTPMKHGPFKGFLEALGKLQKKFYDKGEPKCPIRTYLVTSRGAASAGTRALITLRSWDLEMDEAHFMSGAPKGPMLEKIRPHIFFDDQMCHVDGAKDVGTVACHVPYTAWVSS